MRPVMIEQLVPINHAPQELVAETVGALSGSALSLVYMLPETCREAVARFVVGLGVGVVFARPVGLKLSAMMGLGGQLSSVELSLMGAATASLTAWWVLGATVRFLRSYRPK